MSAPALEKVIGFVPKVKGDVNADPRIMRWHGIAGLCLIHGYRIGAELGVSKGRFTMYLCATMHDMKMTAVDLWEEQPGNTAPGAQTYENWTHDENLSRFKGLCADYFPNRVRILRMDTVKAADFIDDESLDFVFIDADHSFEGCTRDIDAWEPKVRKGGMVAGHDYHWPTVRKAVDARGWPKIGRLHDHVWVHFK